MRSLEFTIIFSIIILIGYSGIQESFADESYKVEFFDKEFGIDYRISNASVRDIDFDEDMFALVVDLNAINEGSIFLSYPYRLNGFGYVENCYSDTFFVILNGNEVGNYKIQYRNSVQIFEIPFEKGQNKIVFSRGYVPEDTQYFLKCVKQNIDTMSPHKQLGMGIKNSEIICKLQFELVLKDSVLTPACVTSETAEKLIQRGWAQSTKPIPKCIDSDINSITELTICGFFR